jgi:iron complex transport system substrate-binding protein
VISIVPAVTEILFDIGAGPRVVAVSSFDKFPADVDDLPRVGALLDPDLETILKLRPDLVIVYASQTDLRLQLERAKTPMFVYAHGGLADVTSVIRTLGTCLGLQTEAEAAARRLETRLEDVRTRVRPLPRPRTLLVFGRDRGTLRSIHASGGVGFLHDVLTLAGGANVFGDTARESVQVSLEAILAKAPELILELRYTEDITQERAAREAAVWSAMGSIPAVQAGRVHVLVGDQFVVPGPRIAAAAEEIARTIHPQAFAR